MPVQKEVILARLNANNQKIIELLPPELVAEYKNKIIRPLDLKEYSETIFVALQFNDQTSMIRIENWLADRFKIGNFGRKLAEKGFNPGDVFEQFLKGFFDYK
jgi:hypothetical protein